MRWLDTRNVIALLTGGVGEQPRQTRSRASGLPLGSRERRRVPLAATPGSQVNISPSPAQPGPGDGSRAPRPLQVSRAQPAGTPRRVPPPACRRNRAGSGGAQHGLEVPAGTEPRSSTGHEDRTAPGVVSNAPHHVQRPARTHTVEGVGWRRPVPVGVGDRWSTVMVTVRGMLTPVG